MTLRAQECVFSPYFERAPANARNVAMASRMFAQDVHAERDEMMGAEWEERRAKEHTHTQKNTPRAHSPPVASDVYYINREWLVPAVCCSAKMFGCTRVLIKYRRPIRLPSRVWPASSVCVCMRQRRVHMDKVRLHAPEHTHTQHKFQRYLFSLLRDLRSSVQHMRSLRARSQCFDVNIFRAHYIIGFYQLFVRSTDARTPHRNV